MSFTFPSRDSRQWQCAQNGDSFGTIIGSKNLDLDEEGYAKLAPRTVKIFGNTDSSGFDRLLAVNHHDGDFWAFTDDNNFIFEVDGTGTIDGETGNFSGTSDSVVYGSTQWASRVGGSSLLYRSTGAWSTLSASLTTSGNPHPLCVFESAQQLAVGDGSRVKLISDPDNLSGSGPTYVSGTILQLPPKHTVTSIAYNNGFLYIGTKVKSGQAYLFLWDGSDASADNGFPVPTNYVACVTPYESSVAVLTAQGQILRFNGGGFDEIAALPCYYSGLDWAQFTNSVNTGHRSMVADGSLLYVNVSNGERATPIDFPDERENAPDLMPAGVYVYDPAVGLYHRHGPSQAKRSILTISTSDVNTATDVLTVSAAPATGTPCVASIDTGDWGPNVLNGAMYFAIQVSATTMKLATTRANALAGTAIDITAALTTGTLFCFPETDFGQYLSERGYCVEPNRGQEECAWWESSRLFFGGETATPTSLSAGSECLNTAAFSVPNRGYLVTAKVQAEAVTEGVPCAYVRFRPLTTAEDAIVVKHRNVEKAGFPIRYASVVWTSPTVFTTTDARFANVEEGHEIEVIQGRAAGCLAHVSSISTNAGTYTVNLDESLPEVAASDVSRVTVDNWAKVDTITSSSETNAKGFHKTSELGRDGVFHQLKVEYRGAEVAVREVFVEAAPNRTA